MRAVGLVLAALVLPAAASAACVSAGGTARVAAPQLVRNIATGETGWFSSPSLVDLNGDGKLEIVAPFYSTFVFSATGKLLGKGTATKGRVYAPEVVAGNEIVVGGNDGTVAAYRLAGGKLRTVWTASTCSGGQCPETRGLAAGDLDGDGRIEVVATTTNTADAGKQVFVFEPDGSLRPGWPRAGGYGAYGENVGIGDVDGDPQLEVVATFDNHTIHVFDPDGVEKLASPWFTDRQTGRRLAWGDFIRWLDPAVEARQYHAHTGEWPDVEKTMWLQWTASPPSVADLDGDGRNEVIGLPNAELGEPYVTQGYAFVALEGDATRQPGFVRPVLTAKPSKRAPGDWYPPDGIPAPTVVDIAGDARPEIVASVPGGSVYAVGPTGKLLWRHRYARAPKTFASEVVAADLNRDGKPELVFGTYALAPGSGRLVVLSSAGKKLYDVRLPHQGRDGNGIGVPAAPSIADLDGDGKLEIVLTTFDHGLDVFRVPGSGTNCLPWPTGRGSLLRAGTVSG
jgi:hypothetical protein